ncbi:hypothetical protein [Streptomyces sp. NPDC055140]
MARLIETVITRLTPAERRVLEQMSLGCDPGAGSVNLTMARATFNRYSTQIGQKLQVKKAPVKVQMGFVSGELPLPAHRPAPVEFDEKERLLWQAHALHCTAADIAKHAGIGQFELADDTARLMAKAGAINEPHLIRLGHVYEVLTRDDVPAPFAA